MTYKSWYAIKPKQPTNHTFSCLQPHDTVCKISWYNIKDIVFSQNVERDTWYYLLVLFYFFYLSIHCRQVSH